MKSFLILAVLVFTYSPWCVLGQEGVELATTPSPPTAAPSCGCCPVSKCGVRATPCSSNLDCECLLITSTETGMCANTVISCSVLPRCENDNRTCSRPNTVCVNNTRCNTPVCYPITLATPEVCPPPNTRLITEAPQTTTTPPPPPNTVTETTASTRPSTTTTTGAPTTVTTSTTTASTRPSTTTTTGAPTTVTTTTTTASTRPSTTTTTTASTTVTTTMMNACSNGTRCLNNGTCQPSGTSYYCICRPMYYGANCQTYGSGTDLSTLDRIINGSLTTYERTVENVLNRHNWTNTVAVVDVTGSMQVCTGAIFKWISMAAEKMNTMKYFVFFNDGDSKADSTKVIGSTGGLYGIANGNLSTILATIRSAMRNGNGGDVPENDIEALLFGIRQCPNCSNVIHIADNQATPRDMSLLDSVTKPVKVLICQSNGSPVNVNLVNIALKTGGSIHTLEQDIINLSGIPIGGSIVIGTRTYRRTASGYVLV